MTHHSRVPRDRVQNARFRLYILRRCRQEPKYRRAVLLACRQDILFWINTFVIQHNPNAIGEASEKVGPFLTWDFQEEVIRELEGCIDPATRDDALIEKSREMGASWLCLLLMTHRLLFASMEKYLCISRNMDAVDKPGDSDSLFWKIDYILSYLPAWMKVGVKRRKHILSNTANGCSIVGQASTGKAGVGGRATAMFIDEFSQITEDYQVLHRTSDTTGSRIFNGTHVGSGTAFYELSQRVDWKIIRMHWSQHPDKRRGLYHWNPETNQIEILDRSYPFPPDYPFVRDGKPAGGPFPGLRSPWYDDQCRRKGNLRAVAMDLDIDPHGSQAQFFDPLQIRLLIRKHCLAPYWEGDISYDPDTAEPVKLVPKTGGRVRLWVNLNHFGLPPKGFYGAGADISAGVGETPSTFCLGNAETGEKVLEVSDAFCLPDEFAKVCVALCRLFLTPGGDPAMFAWEMGGGPGATFTRRIIELGYRRIYYRRDELDIRDEISDKPGWYPNEKTIRVLLDDYRLAITTGQLINRSEEAMRETLAFNYTAKGTVEHATVASKDNPAGARANHGDLVMGDALMWKMMKGFERKLEEKQEEKKIHPGSLEGRRLLAFNGNRQRSRWLARR